MGEAGLVIGWPCISSEHWKCKLLREMVRKANRGDSREPIRSKKNLYFLKCERFAQIASNLRFAIFSPRKHDSQERGVQFGNPDTTRENQAIRANRFAIGPSKVMRGFVRIFLSSELSIFSTNNEKKFNAAVWVLTKVFFSAQVLIALTVVSK